ncbi:hypothetical protein T492DRAFT_873112 [Pavlovales sp. CCMP2436]|nr:hypothetical protein T492DRAFT_873112 [Pavlovales sp. CCMP2436]
MPSRYRNYCFGCKSGVRSVAVGSRSADFVFSETNAAADAISRGHLDIDADFKCYHLRHQGAKSSAFTEPPSSST